MFIEVHAPEKVALNTAFIECISETSEGNALIEIRPYDSKAVHKMFICEESYEEVWSAIAGEEDDDPWSMP